MDNTPDVLNNYLEDEINELITKLENSASHMKNKLKQSQRKCKQLEKDNAALSANKADAEKTIQNQQKIIADLKQKNLDLVGRLNHFENIQYLRECDSDDQPSTSKHDEASTSKHGEASTVLIQH